MKFLNEIDGADKVKQDSSNRFVTDTQINNWNNKQNALGYTPLNSNLKGANGGLAELDSSGKVPSSQLPSYVDDVLEYVTLANFPSTGESGKIYVAIDTNLTYRWGGTGYVEISPSLALGETSSTAYRGDRGKIAYDHSQSTHARADATKVENSTTNGNIKINGVDANVYTHPSGTNPHGTTKSDVGLGNVDNIQQASKSEFNSHNNDNTRHITSTERTNWNNKWDYSENTIKAVKVNKAVDADTINGKTVGINVPSDAVFTDTIYTHPTTAGSKHIPSGGSTGKILGYGGSSGTSTWVDPPESGETITASPEQPDSGWWYEVLDNYPYQNIDDTVEQSLGNTLQSHITNDAIHLTATQVKGIKVDSATGADNANQLGGVSATTYLKKTEATTMQNTLTAQSNNKYTTRQVRNIILSTDDANLSLMQDGDIWIKYKGED